MPDDFPQDDVGANALMLRRAVIAAAILLACGLAWAALVTPGGSGWKVRRAKAAVAHDLQDPASAKFRDVYQTHEAVCGRVNARNGYGVYTGFKRFYVVGGVVKRELTEPGRPVPGLTPDAETFHLGWRVNCGPQA
jgi:hypothetical protein